MSGRRAKNIGKNSFLSIFSQLLIIAFGFFSQRVINVKLGTELVGLNGVISNVIAIFSVTELGLSTAVIFQLYRALAEENEERIAALMNLYRKAYSVIALTIAVIGLLFMPFVHLFLKGNHFALSYVRLIYGLWLARTVFGYLLSYKRAMILADQRDYVVSLATMAVSIFQYGAVIVIVLATGNYALALGLGVLFEVFVNFCMLLYVDHAYPYLKKYRKAICDHRMKKDVFADVKNLFVTRVAQKFLVSTDNLIMSSFIGLYITGLYSNYCLITQSLINILQGLAFSLQPTVGNLLVVHDEEKEQTYLNSFTFITFYLAAIVFSGVTAVASYFVGDIWLGRTFLLSWDTVFLCAANMMLYLLALPMHVFVGAAGLFELEKKVAVTATAANLIVSLVLVTPLGITGVLLGTSIAYLILIIGKAIGFCKERLNRSATPYLLTIGMYVILAAAESFVSMVVVDKWFAHRGILGFLLAGCVCVLIPAVLNFLLFFQSKTFRQLLALFHAYRESGRK
ncbi:MAG: hypothetical protein II743_10530 [Lachnospiraceae bacterium]|nr:hypothetical protein [Lachnospiraceae bacterium]